MLVEESILTVIELGGQQIVVFCEELAAIGLAQRPLRDPKTPSGEKKDPFLLYKYGGSRVLYL